MAIVERGRWNVIVENSSISWNSVPELARRPTSPPVSDGFGASSASQIVGRTTIIPGLSENTSSGVHIAKSEDEKRGQRLLTSEAV